MQYINPGTSVVAAPTAPVMSIPITVPPTATTTITTPSHSSVVHSRDIESPFAGMSGGLAYRAPGEDAPAMNVLMDSLASMTKKSERPYKTKAEFTEALTKWLNDQRKIVSSDMASAQTSYVMQTQQFMNDVGVDGAFKYHQACQKAASHSPPLYNPIIHGGRYTDAYIDHIQPILYHSSKASFARPVSTQQRRKRIYKSGSASTTGAMSTIGSCRLHPHASHTDAQCHQQQGSRNRPRQATQPAAVSNP